MQELYKAHLRQYLRFYEPLNTRLCHICENLLQVSSLQACLRAMPSPRFETRERDAYRALPIMQRVNGQWSLDANHSETRVPEHNSDDAFEVAVSGSQPITWSTATRDGRQSVIDARLVSAIASENWKRRLRGGGMREKRVGKKQGLKYSGLPTSFRQTTQRGLRIRFR